MSFRRFLYMMWDVEAIDGSCSLRRIDTSRLFFRTSTEGTPAPLDSGGIGAGATDPSAAHDGGRLPDPAIEVGEVVHALQEQGRIRHRLHGLQLHVRVRPRRRQVPHRPRPAQPDRSQVLALLPRSPSARACTSWTRPPCAATAGRGTASRSSRTPTTAPSEASRTGAGGLWTRRRSWSTAATNATPSTPTRWTPGGSGILVSNNASRLTYRFDTASGAWRKAGDWVLPFTNLAEYLPEHNLWPSDLPHRRRQPRRVVVVVGGDGDEDEEAARGARRLEGVRRASAGVDPRVALRGAPGLLQVLHRQVLLHW
ncbi:uncharacterized protein [Miscanthus floridulus]|uniref:uncharacterized protein n=1 Tax=Miscanthus floridulus TaxID=154761 RepID=UPI003457E166